MHASSMENMRRCIDWYVGTGPVKVVDLGAMDVNGSYRQLVPPTAEYVGADLEAGPGVDVVLTNVYHLPFEDGSVDIVLSGQMLEHCGQFWRVFNEIFRVLKPDGLAFMIAPSSGPVHMYPVDCYRFYPDSYPALAEWSGLRLVQSWTDERGPWRDIVGVFQKGSSRQPMVESRAAPVAANRRQDRHRDPTVEVRAGARPYVDVLRDLHALINPRLYLEIGIGKGSSLALATRSAIAIDPDPHPGWKVSNPAVTFYRCTSDDFFFFHGKKAFPGAVELAFIDGMHLAEYVYRDFMNVERWMHPKGAIVIDDVLPNHPVQANRERQSQVWTGDVWRFAALLARKRPDLHLSWFDTAPSGLLVISRANPKNMVLWDDYNPTMRQLANDCDAAVPEQVLSRSCAVAPTLENLHIAIGR
jgi:predicted O-methyltransferase YrrM